MVNYMQHNQFQIGTHENRFNCLVQPITSSKYLTNSLSYQIVQNTCKGWSSWSSKPFFISSLQKICINWEEFSISRMKHPIHSRQQQQNQQPWKTRFRAMKDNVIKKTLHHLAYKTLTSIIHHLILSQMYCQNLFLMEEEIQRTEA